MLDKTFCEKSVPKKWFPLIVMMVWLLFLGISIWSRAVTSQQPPIYDPLGYIQKSKNFWETIDHGKWVNPLNIVPTVRPPGTILLAYPFGFSADYSGFKFRSVYIPIVSVVIAVYMTAGLSRVLAMGWGVSAVALLFSSLPLFYHFEFIEGMQTANYWGLTDNFQAGIAAMAAGAIVRSLNVASLRWLGFGGMLASFTLLIKPSGLMAMALLGVTWFILAIWSWWKSRGNFHLCKERQRFLISGTMLLLFLFASSVLICVSSQYISSANLNYAKQALVIMKSVLAISFSFIPTLIHPSIGEVLLVWALAIIILSVFNTHKPHKPNDQTQIPKPSVFLAMAGLVWGGGAWYWLVVQAGGNQIRYFFPFAMIGIIYLVPMAMQVWQFASRRSRMVLLLICILPVINMACLLIQKNPSVQWQKASGVNISVGTTRAEEAQARTFLEEVRKSGKKVYVYSFNAGVGAMAFENIGSHEALLRPDEPHFITKLQIDWINGFVTRLSDVLSCDYLLFRPVTEEAERQRLLQIETIESFHLENQVFQAWLSGLTEKNGVRVVSESSVRLLEIFDGAQFERDLEQFVSPRSWHAYFNKSNPRRYWNASEVADYVKIPAEKEIQFGDLYKLHALMLSHEAENLKVEIWWEELKHEENNKQRAMFFHLLDSQWNIVYNQQIGVGYYRNIDADRRLHYDSITFTSPDTNTKLLGFGVYHSDKKIGILEADSGNRDWNGRRVIVPLPIVQ